MTRGHVLVVGKALDQAESRERKIELDRIAAMLSRLGGRGYCVKEESAVYGSEGIDFDPDSDFDLDEPESQPSGPANAGGLLEEELAEWRVCQVC
jgi:hypothetical protein